MVGDHANSSTRSQQTHLGPSEIGSICDRKIAGKFAGLPTTNHVVDPWASVIGTAVHLWLADAFTSDNTRQGVTRWRAECRVAPHPDHEGTGDLYDYQEAAVVDHKILGKTSLSKVRGPDGPPVHYIIQLIMYGKGFRLLGLPVRRLALAAYPRTESTLDGLYVWERPTGPEDDPLIEGVLQLTARRRALGDLVRNGQIRLTDIPSPVSDSECYFCPFYRPQSRTDSGPGCPGPRS